MPASPLRQRRIDLGLTQFAVAQRSDISAGRYSLIERQLIRPTQGERQRLAAVFGESEVALFPRAVDEETRANLPR